jgi:hypothetical protein
MFWLSSCAVIPLHIIVNWQICEINIFNSKAMLAFINTPAMDKSSVAGSDSPQ